MGCTSAKSDRKDAGAGANTYEVGFEQVPFENFINQNQNDPKEDYKFGKKLGEGSFGTVYQVQHKKTREIRAMKKILKESLSRDEQQQKMVNDIHILRQLDHPNILKIYEFYQDKDFFYVVSEFCSGGELFDRITSLSTLSEREAANVIKQVLQVLKYSNKQNIAHRDLKPENIMIDQKDTSKEDYNIKIIDWGCSAKFTPGKFMTSLVGTPYYIAPEVVKCKDAGQKGYTERCDMWSVGGILYWMLAGEPCFNGNSVEEVLDKVRKAEKWDFEGKIWTSISEDAKDLIKRMMTYKPTERITVDQALSHRWILNAPSTQISEEIRKECIQKMKKHRGKNQFANAALAYMTSQLVAKSDKDQLIKAFKQMDKNGDNTITRQELKEYYQNYNMMPEEIEDIINNMDLDGNGNINYTEFVNATIDKQKVFSEEKLKQTFDFFDEDKNGFITKEEIQRFFKGMIPDQKSKMWDQIIKDADKNGDGKIEYKEFCTMMTRMANDNEKSKPN